MDFYSVPVGYHPRLFMFFPFGEIEDTMSTRGLPLMLFPFGEIERNGLMKEV